MSAFPVDAILPDLAASLAANRTTVLQAAPPGCGKTTRVAPFLLDAAWLKGRKILLLEPRRLAARTAAASWHANAASGRRNHRLPHPSRTPCRAARASNS